MPYLQHATVAFCHALAACAHLKLARPWSVIEGRRLVMEAGQLEGLFDVLILWVTLAAQTLLPSLYICLGRLSLDVAAAIWSILFFEASQQLAWARVARQVFRVPQSFSLDDNLCIKEKLKRFLGKKKKKGDIGEFWRSFYLTSLIIAFVFPED